MFEHGPQARQILNDAEEDLRDWRLEVDDVRISSHMLDSNLMPNVQNTRNVAESSYEEDETIYTDTPRAQMNTQMGQSMMGQTQTNTTQMTGGNGMGGGSAPVGGQTVPGASQTAQMA